MMKIPVHIYAFVGVIGSGKSYRLEQMKESFNRYGQVTLVGDFSDGIRKLVQLIFDYNDKFGDVNSGVYRLWKDGVACQTSLAFSELNSRLLTGRDLLRNVGEGVKEVAGDAVWANYTANALYDKVMTQIYRSDVCVNEIQVLFGSVRFPKEVTAVFDLYNRLRPLYETAVFWPDIHFIFCDYHSKAYCSDSSHASEMLAQSIVKSGQFKDGDDITELMKQFI